MTSLKTAQLHHSQSGSKLPPKINNQSKKPICSDEIQNSSSDQEKQRIVNLLFPMKKKHKNKNKDLLNDEEDSDVKAFLEQQVPGLYRAQTTDQNCDHSSSNSNSEESESPQQIIHKDTDYYMDYSLCQGPKYLQMSKNERLSYFESLNAIYAARMRVDEVQSKAKQDFNNQKNETMTKDPSLTHAEKQTDQQKSVVQQKQKQKQPLKKRGIKFNQIVFQVPFNKDEQPCVIKHTPEQQDFIVFDDEAYEDDMIEDELMQKEILIRDMLRLKGMRKQVRKGFVEEDEEEDSDEEMYEMGMGGGRVEFLEELNAIQKYNGQEMLGLEGEESDDGAFFSDSEDDLLGFEDLYQEQDSEDEEQWPQDELMNEEEQKENNKRKLNRILEEEMERRSKKGGKQEKKTWKRNIQGQFMLDDDESSQSQENESVEVQDENDDEDEFGQFDEAVEQQQSNSSGESSQSSGSSSGDGSNNSSSGSDGNKQSVGSSQSEKGNSSSLSESPQNNQDKDKTLQEEPQFHQHIKGRKIPHLITDDQEQKARQTQFEANHHRQTITHDLANLTSQNQSQQQTIPNKSHQQIQNTSKGQLTQP